MNLDFNLLIEILKYLKIIFLMIKQCDWVQFSSVVQLCLTLCNPWSAGRQASLSITFVGKVIFLHLNMLSRLVITSLPRSKRLLISWLQSPSAVIFEPPKNKVWHCFHCFPIYLPWSDGTRCHDFRFLNVELYYFF